MPSFCYLNPIAFLGLDRLGAVVATLASFLREFWPIVVPVLLGMTAVYLLLPRVGRYPPLWGALLGGLALVFAGWSLIRAENDLAETILFFAFSAIALVAGVLLITQRNPGRAALSFALVVLSTCGLFLLQAAPFLMAATIIIYAGAIVVTFLFVIMLAQQAGLSDADQRSREPLLATIAGFVLLGGLLCVLQRNYNSSPLESLEDKFDKADRAARAKSVEEMEAILGNDGRYFSEFREGVATVLQSPQQGKIAVNLSELKNTIDEAEQQLNSARATIQEKALQFRKIAEKREQILYTLGSLQPSANALPLSGFSGLRPNLPAKDIPLDKQGKPAMPAANVASLGRSLFTDYVLAVELAGTLLLVAVIGAIAIAGRRPEGLR